MKRKGQLSINTKLKQWCLFQLAFYHQLSDGGPKQFPIVYISIKSNLPFLKHSKFIEQERNWDAYKNNKIKWKAKKYHNVGTFPKFKRKILERGKIGTPSTQILDRSIFWLGTGTSIKKVAGLSLFYRQKRHWIMI